MQHDGIGRISILIVIGSIGSAAVAGMQSYALRDLLAALLFFCILFAAIGIVVVTLLVIDEIGSRAVRQLRTHSNWALLPRRHATIVGAVVPAVHKSRD